MFAEHFHENEWTELHTEAEADELARLVDMCNSDPAHVRKAEPQTVTENSDSVYGNLLNPAWYVEMLARHADALDWQQTRESDYPR